MGIRCVGDGPVGGEAAHAVANGADMLEQVRHFPHDPLAHAVELEHQAHSGGDSPRADGPIAPEHDAQAGDGGKQRCIQQIQAGVEAVDAPHLGIHGAQEGAHGIARIVGLALGVGKQLDRADIGISIHHAPGHLRALVGLGLGDGLQARQKDLEQDDIAAEPGHKRQRQARIGAGHHNHHAAEVDGHIQQHVHEFHHHFADGQSGLHHLGGDAPGKVVLEIRQ